MYSPTPFVYGFAGLFCSVELSVSVFEMQAVWLPLKIEVLYLLFVQLLCCPSTSHRHLVFTLTVL